MTLNPRWPDFDFPIEIKSSKRKTLALVIRHGRLEVLAPQGCPEVLIAKFLQQKTTWIQRKMAEHLACLRHKPPEYYQTGSLLFLLGDAKALKLLVGNQPCIVSQQFTIELTVKTSAALKDQAVLKRLLKQWYRQQTLQLVQQLCDSWGLKMGQLPRHVAVRSYKARWGCCSRSGQLTFHDLLVMAPLKVVEYVVIHELAHLHHHNHSPAFWQLVATFDPEYKGHQQWLAANAYRIAI